MLNHEPRAENSPALILDRDGVIVEEVGHLHCVSEVALIPGAAEAIAAANRMGWLTVIATNQAGVGRGLYGWQEFKQVQEALHARLAQHGARIDGVFACPFHPHGVGPYAHADHPARKPRPGMLVRAAELLKLDLKKSWLVGDKASDLAAARSAGLAGGCLVLTGHGPEHLQAAQALQTADFSVQIVASIRCVITILESTIRRRS